MAVGTKIGDLFFDVSADTAKAVVGIPKAGATLGASLAGSIGRGMSRAVGAITQPLISGLETAAAAGAAAFGSALALGFGRLRSIDDARGKLIALGHTTEDVANIMDSALQAVLGTQYNLGEAATIAASAVAAGIQPGKELTDYLTLIADTATVAGISLESAGGIINKTTAFQRVYLREINQLAQRGIPVFTWLQEEYGVTGEKLREMVSAGEVDAATFQRVIEEHIGGAAKTFGLLTFSGGWRNTLAAMSRLGEAALRPFFNATRDKVFPTLIATFDALTAKVTPLMDAFANSQGFQSVLAALGTLPGKVGPLVDDLSNIGDALGPLIGVFGAAGLGQISKFLGPFGAFIPKIGLLTGAFLGLVVVSPELRSALGEVFKALGEVATALTPLLPSLSELIALLASEVLAPAIRVLADGISWLAEQVGKAAPYLQTAADAAREFIEGFKGGFGENFKKDSSGALTVAGRLGERLRDVVDVIVDEWWPTAKNVLVGGLKLVGAYVTWWVDNVLPLFVSAFKFAVNWVTKNWPTIQAVVTKVVDAVVHAIQVAVNWVIEHWPEIYETIREVLGKVIAAGEAVVRWFQANWPAIQSAIATTISAISAAIEWFVTNILPHLIEGFQSVASFVQEIWPQVASTVKDALELVIAIVVGAALAIEYIWDTFGKTILLAVETVWSFIKEHIQGALDVIQGLINVVLGIITGDWGRAWDGIKQFVFGIWEEIKAIIDLAINSVRTIISFALDNLQVAWDIAWTTIKAVVEAVWSAVTSVISGQLETIKAAVSGAVDWITSTLQSGWDAVSGAVSTAWTAISDGIATAWDTITSTVSDGIWKIFEYVRGIPEGVANAIGDGFNVIWTKFKDVVNLIIRGWNGIHFPSFEIGGWDPPGPGPTVPGVTVGGWSVPQIPEWHHSGGIAGANQPRGTDIAAVLRAREMVLTEGQQSRLFRLLDGSMSALGAGAPTVINVDARGSTDPAAVEAASQRGVLTALAQYTKAR